MCGLYGVLYYGDGKIDMVTLTQQLAHASTVRGVQATGIAYNTTASINHDDKLKVVKEGISAYEFDFTIIPEDVKVIMGHTRRNFSFEGADKHNYNNHPFLTQAGDIKFAFAHNGVLKNIGKGRRKFNLPKTKIDTDSYLAVQLFQHFGELTNDSMKFVAENVEGVFTFSILDQDDNIHIIKQDNPIAVIHYPALELYIYASTKEIVKEATRGFAELKEDKGEWIEVYDNEILTIKKNGEWYWDSFNCSKFETNSQEDLDQPLEFIIDYVCDMAVEYGYDEESVFDLLSLGYSLSDIEGFILDDEVDSILRTTKSN